MDEKQKLFDARAEDIFNKLISLHRWDEQRRGAQPDGAAEPPPRIVQALIRLSRHESEFEPAVAALEGGAREAAKAQPAAPPPPAAPLPEVNAPPLESLSATEWKQVWAAVVSVRPLRALFASDPSFSKTEPRQLAVLAQLADVTPDETLQLSTQDGVLTLMLQRNLPGADAMLLEYLVKVLTLYLTDAPLTQRLAAMADKPYWQVLLSSLEDGVDYTEGSDAEAGEALGVWSAGLGREQRTDLQLKLGSPPRLSQTPPELVALAWERRDDLEETKKQVTTHVAPSPSAAAQAGGPQVTAQTDIRGWAVEVRGRLRAAGALDDVEYALRLRAEVAAHLIEVRKIAKVETLRYRWPDAARLALQNRLSIVEVEEHLGRLQTSPERPAVFTSDEARDLYALSEQDRQFRRFLRLRPHFVDIPFFQYLSASPLPDAVTTATPATSPGPQAGTPTVAQSASQRSAPDAQQIRGDPSTPPTQGEVTPTPTTTPAIEQTPPPARTTPAAYETYVFKLHSVTDRAAGGGIVGYSAGIRFPDGSEGSGPAEIGSKLFEEVYTKSIGVPPDQRVQQFLSRMFARQDTEYLFRLVRAGQALFGGVFGRLWKALEANDVFNKNKIVKAPGAETSARVVIETDDARVAESWPWEWLAFPDQRDLFMMGEKHSLVRAFPRSVPVPEKQLNPPLRILVVAPSYSADTLEDSKLRVEFLKELFPQQTPSEAPPPKLMILSGDEVTEERLHNAIFDFIPHVLHFEGRVGGYEAADNSRENLFLFLSYRDGSHEQLSVPRFEQMLNSAEVQLMVIEPGPYVTFIGWEALAFCKGLMAGALPAAVMPVREVGDATVGEFLRGFYRALLEGQTLEAAVSKARLGLLGRGGDWTAFALFSDPETLDKSRLVPPTA